MFDMHQPARGDIPRNGCCHHKATSDNPHIAQVKHLDNLACRCAIDLANGNLRAAVPRLEHHNTEDSHQHDYDSQPRK